MKLYKLFLTKICDIENVSVKEIMELTGKSQSVVYSWLNLSKPECFPTIESLGKILFRLGISFDDFINLRHPVYDDGDANRVYYLHTYGSIDRRYIGEDILKLPNAYAVMDTYLLDRMCLNKMVDDYVNGLEIDKNRFDLLCKALMPIVVSEVNVEIGDSEIYELDAYSLQRYKFGIECLRDCEAECLDNDMPLPMHEVCFPDANIIFLLAAEKDLGLLKNYLSVIDESDKRCLLKYYTEFCSNNPKFDKKKKINKLLIENGVEG